ncbi:MAG TPA: FtsX-like permease family protein, partial [Candidatus Polarisedimenticolia bacterium]|nr:FtsX-like permease family protein [Candidatus Polarisedimenticolia bacterium]
ALKEGGRGASGAAGGRRMRNGLVVAEIGLAMLLLLGAGLMVRTLKQLNRVDAGFRPEGILTAELGLPAAKYGEPHQRSAFYARLLEEAGAIPGVKAAGAVSDLPLSGGGNYLSFVVEGRPPVPDGVTVDAIATVATPEWFGAMGIPLVRGRLFSGDDGPGRPKTLVINEAMAARHFPGEDPIGRKISFGGDGADSWITIVGVVGDTRNVSLDEPSYPQAYAPYAQIPQRSMVVTLKTDGDPADRAGAFRALVRRLDPDQPVSGVSTMQTRITDSVAQRRFGMMLLSLFAGLALVLASVGIYGVMSYTVSLRTHEIGIRMALGARGGDVLGMLMRTGLALGLAGVAAGLLLAFPLTRTMAGFLYGVSPTDPLTWSLVAAALVGIALAASYVPARRATRVDPNVALRCE